MINIFAFPLSLFEKEDFLKGFDEKGEFYPNGFNKPHNFLY